MAALPEVPAAVAVAAGRYLSEQQIGHWRQLLKLQERANYLHYALIICSMRTPPIHRELEVHSEATKAAQDVKTNEWQRRKNARMGAVTQRLNKAEMKMLSQELANIPPLIREVSCYSDDPHFAKMSANLDQTEADIDGILSTLCSPLPTDPITQDPYYLTIVNVQLRLMLFFLMMSLGITIWTKIVRGKW